MMWRKWEGLTADRPARSYSDKKLDIDWTMESMYCYILDMALPAIGIGSALQPSVSHVFEDRKRTCGYGGEREE